MIHIARPPIRLFRIYRTRYLIRSSVQFEAAKSTEQSTTPTCSHRQQTPWRKPKWAMATVGTQNARNPPTATDPPKQQPRHRSSTWRRNSLRTTFFTEKRRPRGTQKRTVKMDIQGRRSAGSLRWVSSRRSLISSRSSRRCRRWRRLILGRGRSGKGMGRGGGRKERGGRRRKCRVLIGVIWWVIWRLSNCSSMYLLGEVSV